MEQLLWTTSIAGCLLADEAEGETVKLPPALRRAFRGEASTQLPQSAAELRSCAVSVPMAVVTMATFASDARASAVLSPRLMAVRGEEKRGEEGGEGRGEDRGREGRGGGAERRGD